MMSAWEILTPFVMSSLPSDIDQRFAVLDALAKAMPPSAPERDRVIETLFHLSKHRIAQREFEIPQISRGSSRLGDAIAERGRKGAR